MKYDVGEPDRAYLGWYVYVGWVYGMLTALAWVLLSGCASKAPTLPGVLPVAITAWPSPIKPTCQLSDLPAVPDVFVWTQISEEEAGRIYINQRQLADLVVWLKDVHHWAGLQTKCIERLVTQ